MKKLCLLFCVLFSCQLFGQVNVEGVLIYNNSDFNSTVNKLSQKLGAKPSEKNIKEGFAQWTLLKNETMEVTLRYDAFNSENKKQAIITSTFDLKKADKKQALQMLKKMYDENVKEYGKEYKRTEDSDLKAYDWKSTGRKANIMFYWFDYLIGGNWRITAQEISLK